MTIKDFREVYGSGCLFNLGVESQNGWILEKATLFKNEDVLKEYDDAEINNLYVLNNTGSEAILAVVIDG